jgi:hypothetical protein
MQVLQTSVPSSLMESNSCSVSGSSGMNRIEWKRLASLSFERGTAALDGGEIREWALDFAHDAVACGRAIRVLSVDALSTSHPGGDPVSFANSARFPDGLRMLNSSPESILGGR